ncbi:MAG: class I SAM-dependent methyltransferase [bacterium]|nr:class I SAM-dependent methyltransferase [bacterium]
MTILIFFIGLLIGIILATRILIPLGIAIFVPSPTLAVKMMVYLAKVKQGEKAADLGSGDGRVVIALAKAGAEAHGYDINPFLVLKARKAIRREGLEGKAFIHWGNFFWGNLSSYDIITLFISPLAMKMLESKLKRELKAGARIVSFKFLFPSWPHKQKESGFYMYEQSR